MTRPAGRKFRGSGSNCITGKPALSKCARGPEFHLLSFPLTNFLFFFKPFYTIFFLPFSLSDLMATHSITPHDPNEAKRWLIIGAYQAGASESRIARISGLSRTAVRRIILNYQRTEIPSLPQELPRSGKIIKIQWQ